MQTIDFVKMHGLGNDFVIIDKRSQNINISKEIINKLSDRRSGAGCDQLITINNSSSTNYDAFIEIFNPGGDRAEACGNGTRCVAKLLFDNSIKKELKIKSDAGTLIAKKIDEQNISVNLGKLSHNWKDIRQGDQQLCYNEIATKHNWCYMRIDFDLSSMKFLGFRSNERDLDVTDSKPMTLSAMPNLWSMLNVAFWVESDADARAFFYLDRVAVSTS